MFASDKRKRSGFMTLIKYRCVIYCNGSRLYSINKTKTWKLVMNRGRQDVRLYTGFYVCCWGKTQVTFSSWTVLCPHNVVPTVCVLYSDRRSICIVFRAQQPSRMVRSRAPLLLVLLQMDYIEAQTGRTKVKSTICLIHYQIWKLFFIGKYLVNMLNCYLCQAIRYLAMVIP